MKNRFFHAIAKCYKLHERVLNWTIVLALVLGIFLVYHFWYSISVSGDLRYPQQQRSLILRADESIVVKRGMTQEEHVYKLGAGEYLEVLVNDEGSFFLAPKMGFYKTSHPKDGYAVGGFFVPKGNSDHFFVWEWPLKNENRSFQSPSIGRVLSMDHDQPEREWFLNPDWYKNKGFEIHARPLIDTDFKIARNKFDEAVAPDKAPE